MAKPFDTHEAAAMALLCSGAKHNRVEGQFCGGISFNQNLSSEKQRSWLSALFKRHGLLTLAVGAAA